MRGAFIFVGPPGIEPGLYAPEAHVLPVYYGPISGCFRLINILLVSSAAKSSPRRISHFLMFYPIGSNYPD